MTEQRWNLRGSRVLITGGAGLVGSHIADKLAQSTVEALGNDVEVRWVDGPDRPALLAGHPHGAGAYSPVSERLAGPPCSGDRLFPRVAPRHGEQDASSEFIPSCCERPATGVCQERRFR